LDDSEIIAQLKEKYSTTDRSERSRLSIPGKTVNTWIFSLLSAVEYFSFKWVFLFQLGNYLISLSSDQISI